MILVLEYYCFHSTEKHFITHFRLHTGASEADLKYLLFSCFNFDFSLIQKLFNVINSISIPLKCIFNRDKEIPELIDL